MKRRDFVTCSAAGIIMSGITNPLWAMGQKQDGKDYDTAKISPTVVDTIGSHSIQELRNFHQKELDEQYIALWDKYGIDRRYGGFTPDYNQNGTPVADKKEMYYLGRGIWVFSYLYNHFGKNERHLKAAKMAIDFIYKYCDEGNGVWTSEVSLDGKKKLLGSFNIYGDIYVALGLGEYYKATGDTKARDVALETAYSVNKRIVAPEYQHLNGHALGHEPGTKRLGTWQHFLNALTPLARYTGDYGTEMIARMCLRNILERHLQPEYGLAFEHLDDQFKPFRSDPFDNHRIIHGWHSVQAAWMCMDEALRIGHRPMFMKALEFGRNSLERCWVEGEKGGLVVLPNPEAKSEEPSDYAPSGAMDDALIFTLFAVEHTHAPWAVYWYNKIFEFGYKKPDRWRRVCLLHHPRRLFHTIEILDRMIARKGKVSGFFEC